MRKLLFFFAIISFLSACSLKSDSFNLSGQIEGLNNQEMILQFVSFKEIVDIDTTTSDELGKYEFEGKLSEPGFYRIAANGKYWMIRLENEKVVYNAKFDDDELKEVVIDKSEKAKAFQDVLNFFIAKQKELNAFGQQYQTLQFSGASLEDLKAVEDQYMAAQKAMADEVKTRIDASTDPITSIYLMSALQSNEDIAYIKSKLDAYSVDMPNSTYIIEMRENIAQVEAAQAQQAAQAPETSSSLSVGSEAPDFTQKTPQGTDLSLASLRGKVVLLDFWASWCKPCRMENPNVVAAYEKYKSKGFTVLSVSLDKERDAWIAAIAQDKLTWPNHVSDLQFWNNAAAQMYGVQSIPAAFLIDENGIIIGKDLRGPDLEAKLKEVLG